MQIIILVDDLQVDNIGRQHWLTTLVVHLFNLSLSTEEQQLLLPKVYWKGNDTRPWYVRWKKPWQCTL